MKRCILHYISPKNTPRPRRSKWGSCLPPECFVSRAVFPNISTSRYPWLLFISHGTPWGKHLFFKLICFLVISYVSDKVVYCCWVSIYALINDVILFIYLFLHLEPRLGITAPEEASCIHLCFAKRLSRKNNNVAGFPFAPHTAVQQPLTLLWWRLLLHDLEPSQTSFALISSDDAASVIRGISIEVSFFLVSLFVWSVPSWSVRLGRPCS
jgi:hypothetical protein